MEKPQIRPEAMQELVEGEAFQYVAHTLRERYVKDMIAADDEAVVRCRDRIRALDDVVAEMHNLGKTPSKPQTRI